MTIFSLQSLEQTLLTSPFEGDGLLEASGRPRGETLRGEGDRPSWLRLSGLSPRGLLLGEALL